MYGAGKVRNLRKQIAPKISRYGLQVFFCGIGGHLAGNHFLGQGRDIFDLLPDSLSVSCNRGGGRKVIKACMCASRTCTVVVTNPAILRGKIAPPGLCLSRRAAAQGIGGVAEQAAPRARPER
jgi:hypothetical protein